MRLTMSENPTLHVTFVRQTCMLALDFTDHFVDWLTALP